MATAELEGDLVEFLRSHIDVDDPKVVVQVKMQSLIKPSVLVKVGALNGYTSTMQEQLVELLAEKL